MSIVGFRAQNHPQQTRARGVKPLIDDRATAPEVFAPLHARFGFTVDAAAAAHNAKLPRYFDIQTDGLVQSWAGESVWCNPPYSDIRPWIEKAWRETTALRVVLLIPANRTEQPWWQDLIEPFRDRNGSRLHVEFLRGRTRFIRHDRDAVEPNNRPPFGCCLLIWEAHEISAVLRAT